MNIKVVSRQWIFDFEQTMLWFVNEFQIFYMIRIDFASNKPNDTFFEISSSNF